jgi:hypothetical protein
MKKSLPFTLALFLVFNSTAFADGETTNSTIRVIEQNNSSFEYADHMYKMSHLMRVTEGKLVSTSEDLPHDTEEAHEFFEEACAPKNATADLAKKVTIDYQGLYTTQTFECDERAEDGKVNTVQFVVTTDINDTLRDLQINQLSAKANSTDIDPHHMTLKDGGEIAIAVGASLLVSGLMAKQIYAGQQDKFLHATGGSLIAAATTLLAYYGFKVSKNEAALIGFATAVAVGLLKEYAYDTHHTDVHTVDIHDAEATAMGGAAGAFMIRLKFQW